jgi:predicted nuclease of predicted toxin-antitoxin system
MIYYNFIKDTKEYLKSVRVIKDYISFDMIFPNTWSILKNHTKDIEVIKNDSDENKVVISFVTPFEEKSIHNIEDSIKNIVKYNIEREEKERLFKNKVQELKSIFENQKLDSLKSLKFDIEDFTLLKNSDDEFTEGDKQGDEDVESRNREEQEEHQQS